MLLVVLQIRILLLICGTIRMIFFGLMQLVNYLRAVQM